MRYGCVAALAALGSTCAYAQDSGPNFNQYSSGQQQVENQITAPTLEMLTDKFMQTMMGPSLTGSLSQYGSNLVNAVQSQSDLNDVVQRFDGVQTIANGADLANIVALGRIGQSGENMAGIIEGRTINLADQAMGADAEQSIFNSAAFYLLYGSVTQSGINTANMAVADLALGTARQDIAEGAVQLVENELELAAMHMIASIEQTGTNFGNILRAQTVQHVDRAFAGTQIVRNTVILGDAETGPITQSGTNIANYIDAMYGTLKQTSTGTQIVINEVIGPDGQLLSRSNITQNTTNAVNVFSSGSSQMQGDDTFIDLTQNADYPQHASGGPGANSQTGNSATISR